MFCALTPHVHKVRTKFYLSCTYTYTWACVYMHVYTHACTYHTHTQNMHCLFCWYFSTASSTFLCEQLADLLQTQEIRDACGNGPHFPVTHWCLNGHASGLTPELLLPGGGSPSGEKCRQVFPSEWGVCGMAQAGHGVDAVRKSLTWMKLYMAVACDETCLGHVGAERVPPRGGSPGSAEVIEDLVRAGDRGHVERVWPVFAQDSCSWS